MRDDKDFNEARQIYTQYNEIKQLVDGLFVLQEEKKYEDFIKELVMILRI